MAKKSKKKKKAPSSTIVINRKARHEYFISDRFEAGIVLEGWEVKSLRAGRVQINEGFVMLEHGEAFLHALMITPLITASTHIQPEQRRVKKLLLNRRELNKLMGLVEQKGFTLIPTALYWKKNKIKCEIGLAKGKKDYDKRATSKDRDWQRQKERLFKHQ